MSNYVVSHTYLISSHQLLGDGTGVTDDGAGSFFSEGHVFLFG